jgi:uncharacterized protein (TIGR03083 family)
MPAGLRAPAPLPSLEAFPAERAALLDLLRGLSPDEWARPTMCPGWSVKDIAAHLVADDLGRLSGQRDGHRHRAPDPAEPLVRFIDRQNGEWVEAMRRLSGPVVVSLLELSGAQTLDFFRSVDPDAPGIPVSWAAADPAPAWLDLARELTERWHHQAEIREALGAPMLDDPAILGPVHAAFAHGLPVTFRAVVAPLGTTVSLVIPGRAGGAWTVERREAAWRLWLGEPADPTARVVLPPAVAWRMYTRTLPREELRAAATMTGEPALAEQLLTTVSIVA